MDIVSSDNDPIELARNFLGLSYEYIWGFVHGFDGKALKKQNPSYDMGAKDGVEIARSFNLLSEISK
jgi:hypothetical protein